MPARVAVYSAGCLDSGRLRDSQPAFSRTPSRARAEATLTPSRSASASAVTAPMRTVHCMIATCSGEGSGLGLGLGIELGLEPAVEWDGKRVWTMMVSLCSMFMGDPRRDPPMRATWDPRDPSRSASDRSSQRPCLTESLACALTLAPP